MFERTKLVWKVRQNMLNHPDDWRILEFQESGSNMGSKYLSDRTWISENLGMGYSYKEDTLFFFKILKDSKIVHVTNFLTLRNTKTAVFGSFSRVLMDNSLSALEKIKQKEKIKRFSDTALLKLTGFEKL
jgi:hypothetical protein